MEFVLILILNATMINAGSRLAGSNVAPSASVAMATFKTEKACWDAARSFEKTMLNAQLAGSAWAANCVPAGEPTK